jgi:hypothetical protein
MAAHRRVLEVAFHPLMRVTSSWATPWLHLAALSADGISE